MRTLGLLCLVLTACQFPLPKQQADAGSSQDDGGDAGQGTDGGLIACGAGGSCPGGQTCNAGNACEPVACTTNLAASNEHTCAIRSDHTTWCWGSNAAGELGDGTTIDRPAPVQVMTSAAFTQIAAGAVHTCGVDGDRNVWCWGSNELSQLGSGISTPTPRKLGNLTGVTQLTAGGAHNCALIAGGTVSCWGANDEGQVGNGAMSDPVRAPTDVGLTSVAEIATGGDTSCAVTMTGALSCWGCNEDGQLANGGTDSQARPVLVTLPGGAKASHVAVGDNFVCALSTDGAVYCAGNNEDGQLGQAEPPDNAMSKVPLPVVVDSITAGQDFACATEAVDALHDRRRLWCWGEDGNGELADGVHNDHAAPFVTSYADVAVAVGGSVHLCVLSSGRVACSGWNGRGQLGNGHSTTQAAPPPSIAGLTDVRAIATGEDHSCAVSGSDGRVLCWGFNESGQLGDGSVETRARPTPVEGVTGAAALTAGTEHTCARLGDGTAMCWGANHNGQLGNGSVTPDDHSDGTPPGPVVMASGTNLGGITQIAAGGWHTCALLSTSKVMCWGENSVGQVGNGTDGGGNRNDIARPTAVSLPTTASAKEIALGLDHSCALLTTGTVMCWGFNGNGQLGDGTTINRNTPVQVMLSLNPAQPLTGVAHLVAAGSRTCAITTTGLVGCWGQSDPDAHLPETVGTFDAVKLAAGFGHTCMIVGTQARCFGQNGSGQIGDGSYDNQDAPTVVQAPGPVTDLAAGSDHTCALLADKTVTCWGIDWAGQLGDGSFDIGAPVNPLLTCP